MKIIRSHNYKTEECIIADSADKGVKTTNRRLELGN